MPEPRSRRSVHRDPVGSDRTASAPYNFVPLPEKIVRAVPRSADLPSLASYAPSGYEQSGYFDVTLTTLSPLYIRAGLSRERFDQVGSASDLASDYTAQAKNAPEFFYTDRPSVPVIPGSSLRGMLRALLEIVSYGKLQPVTDRRLFYRSVDDTALGKEYRNRMVGSARGSGGQAQVEAGFLQFQRDRAKIRKTSYLRIRHDLLKRIYDRHRRPVPESPGPRDPVFVKVSDRGPEVEDLTFTPSDGYHEGVLVITGRAPRKSQEFVLLRCPGDSEEIPVPAEMIERFEDDDQVTQWQERTFPAGNGRPRAGGLRRGGQPGELGEPVFFLREAGTLTFFGRAGLFRLPYRHTPRDLIPEELRPETEIDVAEALFGFVEKGPKKEARAGRVSVTDATLTAGQADLWLTTEPVTPKILATPKPTAFQHYLVQTSEQKDQLRHYDSPPNQTALRGHKLYWHQGPREQTDLEKGPSDPGSSTQLTRIHPLRAGVTFTFRVFFDNLSRRELGALGWVLEPRGEAGREYGHALGMGKPLGMGAVRLRATLHLIDRRQRYESLFSDAGWETGDRGAASEALEQSIQEFEKHLLETLGEWPGRKSLRELERIRALLKLLEWPGRPDPSPASADESNGSARAMSLERFKHRPVLPGPLAADRRADPPAAPSTPKRAGPSPGPRPARPTGTGGPPRPQPTPPPAPPSGPSRPGEAHTASAPGKQQTPRLGDTLPATVTALDGHKARVRLDAPYQDEFRLEVQPATADRFRLGASVKVKVTHVDRQTGKIIRVGLA